MIATQCECRVISLTLRFQRYLTIIDLAKVSDRCVIARWLIARLSRIRMQVDALRAYSRSMMSLKSTSMFSRVSNGADMVRTSDRCAAATASCKPLSLVFRGMSV